MDGVEIEIVKSEETKESGIKYLNINVSNSEVERNPDIVRLCADAGVLEYVKPKTGHWINKSQRSGCGVLFVASECTCCGKKTPFNCDEFLYRYCPNCGAKMVEPQERKK